MNRSLSSRWSVYGVALLATTAVSVWVALGDRQAKSALAAPVQHPTIGPAARGHAILDLPVREFPEPGVLDKSVDVFATPRVVAAPVSAALPPQAPLLSGTPVTPELPFSFRGLAVDSSGAWLVQLSRGKEYLLVGRGEIIDATYRLDDRAGDQLRFTYLPTAAAQVLKIADHSSHP